MPTKLFQRLIVAGLAAGLVAGPTAAVAAPQTPPAGANITLGGGRLTSAETEALAAYDAAMRDFESRGFAGLERNIPKLRQALDGAPQSYPMIERSGDRWIVRADDMSDALMLSTMASVMAGKADPDRQAQVVTQRNVYPLVALILGSVEVERRNYDAAITYLDRGLTMQPGNWMLLNERLAALFGQGRWEDGLKSADDVLASSDLMLVTHAAYFHRRRGFALVELGRLDEALTAYQTSLETDPDNQTALGEMEYIRGLKAGAPATAPLLIAPNAPQPQPQPQSAAPPS